jgi:transposase
MGAMVGFVLLTVGFFEGSIHSGVFYAWLSQWLVPVLSANAVVVMDNASFHKRTDRVEAMEQSCALLEFLPPYRPDLNPIEKQWAQEKAIRKRERYDVDTVFSVYMNHDKL